MQVVCEESPVGESQSLGSVNIEVQSGQDQVRTLRYAVDTRHGKRIDEHSVVIPWMVQHAAGILNRFRMGIDGRTAYQRVKGIMCWKDTVEVLSVRGT